MTKPVVFVFARAPLYGAVKSRLAKDIGWLEATRFYRRSLSELCRRLRRDPRFETVLAVTPSTALHARGMWPAGLRRVDQGRGDLGQRMMSVLAAAGHRPALVIGSDIPDVQPAFLVDAFRLAASARCVLGPARDGGYWLIGTRHPHRLRRNSLDGVRWSSVHTLRDTAGRLGAVALSPHVLTDVDDLHSLRDVTSNLSQHPRA